MIEVDVVDVNVGGTNYNRISDAIRSAIFSQAFEPGMRLKVQDLARKYAVSPIPIREALQQLQGEGLVVIAPNRGASVRVIDRQLISNIFDIRQAIDGMLARASAPVASTSQIDKLRQIEDSIETAISVSDFEQAGELGRNFHEYIGHIADNLEAVKIRRSHANVFRSVKTAMGTSHVRSSQRRTEHLAIIDALARHDPDGAELVAREHAQAWRIAVLEHFA